MKNYLALVLLYINFTAYSQTPSLQNSPALSEASPASVGMSAERLGRIDAMLQEAIDSQAIPGAVALIARRGKIVYFKAFGTANAEQRKLKTNDIFRIASQTKAITSTAVMMLWEEGKFRLDDPCKTTPAKNEITMRHLLTHTSGIGYG